MKVNINIKVNKRNKESLREWINFFKKQEEYTDEYTLNVNVNIAESTFSYEDFCKKLSEISGSKPYWLVNKEVNK